MRINDYSSIDLSANTIISNQETINPKFIEKILLFLIAFLGIAGSVYVFSVSSNPNNTPNYHNLSLVASASTDYDISIDEKKVKFKNFFKIQGKKKVGELLSFTFKEDRNEQRYVLDMGNGERVIITSDEFPYKYEKAGVYNLELKTINRGLIKTIATKELTIK